MPGITGQRIKGVNEVGQVDTGPVDTTWGRTQRDGFTLQMAVTREQLFSAQSPVTEDNDITQITMSMRFSLLFSELTKLQMAMGIPAAQLSGDLSGGTPTQEELQIDEDSLGSDTKTLYALTPGPLSTRRFEAANCALADVGDLQSGRGQWQLPQVTWDILNTADGTGLLAITDAT